MVYIHQDIQGFDTQIKKLLDKGLIRNNKSSHTSLAFMLRNHAKEKREKTRIVINYNKRNDNIDFNSYYIPNKTFIFNRVQRASWFSSIDYKVDIDR